MERIVDKFLFQPPNPCSYKFDSFEDELFNFNGTVCLFLKSNTTTSRLMIYCHANATDLGQRRKYLAFIRDRMCIHVVGVEYPGYGISAGIPSENSVDECVQNVYDFVCSSLQWPEEQICLVGRSIGTGPALRVAQNRQCGALILLSAFKSIKSLAHSLTGIPENCFDNTWNNIEAISNIMCPTLLVHGSEDKFVPTSHSHDLFSACKAQHKIVAILEGIGHNNFDWNVVLPALQGFVDTVVPRESAVRSSIIQPIQNILSKNALKRNDVALKKTFSVGKIANTMSLFISDTTEAPNPLSDLNIKINENRNVVLNLETPQEQSDDDKTSQVDSLQYHSVVARDFENQKCNVEGTEAFAPYATLPNKHDQNDREKTLIVPLSEILTHYKDAPRRISERSNRPRSRYRDKEKMNTHIEKLTEYDDALAADHYRTPTLRPYRRPDQKGIIFLASSVDYGTV